MSFSSRCSGKTLLGLVLCLLAAAIYATNQAKNQASPKEAASSLTSSTPAGKTITVATGEFPPWTSESLPEGGYVNHLITAAFATENINVKFVYLPWKRAFEKTKEGDFDLSSYWYENDERREAMLFSDPIITNRTVFFQRSADNPIVWSKLNDLSPYKVSVTQGFTYTSNFYRALEEKLIASTAVPSDSQHIKLLMSNRVDLFVTDEMTGFYMAGKLNLDPRKLRVVEPPLNMPTGYLLAGKNNPSAPAIMAAFNRGLGRLKTNGQYEKILDRVDNTSFYNPSTKQKHEGFNKAEVKNNTEEKQ